MAMKGNKDMMTISLTPDTTARLKLYAEQTRRSVSQAITDWVWTLPVNENKDGNNTGVEEK